MEKQNCVIKDLQSKVTQLESDLEREVIARMEVEGKMQRHLLQAVTAHNQRGEELLSSKAYVQALAAFQAGLALDPADEACLQGLQRTQVLYNDINNNNNTYIHT